MIAIVLHCTPPPAAPGRRVLGPAVRALAMALCLLMAAAPAWAEDGGSWYGIVVDQTTQAPLAGARVCAGAQGRVDLACADSRADGTFSVSYDPQTQLWSPPYLFVFGPGDGYYASVRMRPGAGEVRVELVPHVFFVRGVVLDAETGQPLAGATVRQMRPGAIDASITTGPDGSFAFGPLSAFTNPVQQANTYGVPENELPTDKNDGPLIDYPWGFEASAPGYVTISPVRQGDVLEPHLPRTPSVSDAIHTTLTIRLPREGAAVPDPGGYIEATAPESSAVTTPVDAPAPAQGNLALNCPATQSSLYLGTGEDQGAHLAVDGVINPASITPYGLTHTNLDNPAWWQVDLGQIAPLSLVRIYNRIDCCQERTASFEVLLSTDGSTWTPAYQHNRTPFDQLDVPVQGKARYVRIQLTEPNYLSLREVEVYGAR